MKLAEPIIYAIVPVYNGEKNIRNVIVRLSQQMPIKQIVVVNDGSTDETKKELERFEDIIYIHHDVNRGKGAALRSGILYALEQQCEFIITLDSDGQHDPREIPKFIKAAQDTKADIILGSRMTHLTSMPFHRILSNKITSYLVSRRIKCHVKDSQSGFRLFRAEFFNNVTLKCNYFDFETEVLLKAGRKGYKIRHIDITTIYPQNNASAIKLIDMFRFIKLYCRSFKRDF